MRNIRNDLQQYRPAKQKRTHRFRYVLRFGGRWWIRTTEVIDDRFTVWSKPTYLLTISGSFPCFSLIRLSVRQHLRCAALVVSIDVSIDLRDLNGRVSEQGLHGTQLGAALDQIGGISMAQLVRRQAAHSESDKTGRKSRIQQPCHGRKTGRRSPGISYEYPKTDIK